MNLNMRFALGFLASILLSGMAYLCAVQRFAPSRDFVPASAPSRPTFPLPATALEDAARRQARIDDHAPRVCLRHGTVQVRIHSVTAPTANAPLQGLIVACARFPRERLLRVTWYDYGRRNSRSTALYDRQRHTVSFYCRGYDYGPFFKHGTFGGVSDAILRRDAADHVRPRDESAPETEALAFFDDLPRYGCAGGDAPPASPSGWHRNAGLWWRIV